MNVSGLSKTVHITVSRGDFSFSLGIQNREDSFDAVYSCSVLPWWPVSAVSVNPLGLWSLLEPGQFLVW